MMKKHVTWEFPTKGQERRGFRGLEAQRAIIYHYANLDKIEVVIRASEAEFAKR